MNFYIPSLMINCKFGRWMIVYSLKTQKSSFSNLYGFILLLSSMKVGWLFSRWDLKSYLKTRGVVAFLEFDVDPYGDFLFSLIRVIPSYETYPTIVGSKCSTFSFLSLSFPMERIVKRRTSCMTLFFV